MRAGPDMHESYDDNTITLIDTYGSGTIIHSSSPADGTASHRRRPWTVLLSVLTGALLLIPNLALAQGGDPVVNRLDPILRLALERSTQLQEALSRGEEIPSLDRSLGIMAAPVGLEVWVEVLVKGSGADAAVRATGGTVGSRHGLIVTARVPLSAVSTLAGSPGVEYVEASTENTIAMDAGLDSIGADVLHSGAYNYRGSGVLVAVYDTGLDYTHDVFRNGDGTTRVLSMWDQTNDSGTAPSGFTKGSEWSEAQLNDELDGSPAGVVTQFDTHGHGTHVMGIAAGNGQPDSVYVGVAPAADLLVIKGGDGSFNSADIIDGIAWTFTKADILSQPCVLNMSLGGHSGPHDGTMLYEEAVDNAVGTGKVIVISAGNEGSDALHDRTPLSAGAPADSFSFTIPSYSPNSGTSNDYILCNIWYEGSTTVSVSLKDPYGVVYGPVATGGTYGVNTSLGYILIDNASGGADARNSDYQCLLWIYDAIEGMEPDAGSWTIIYNQDSGTSTPVDMWFSSNTFGAAVDVPTSYRSVGSPGTANDAITVGAWVSKWSWDALDGGSYTYTGTERTGDYALFSSWGPSRDGRQKPEISAPGKGIMAAMSSNMTPPIDPWRDPDGVHRMSQGTSQAAPVVTGTIALLLEIDDTLTASTVKSLLQDNAQTDGYTGSIPNVTWGYGKLDALAAADALLISANPPSIAIYQPTGVQSGNVTIEYVISDADNSPVGLLVEGSDDEGTTWQPVTVIGDTSDIAPANYEGSLIWDSASDLANEEAWNLWLRITPHDAGGTGIADTTYGDIDNLAPQWVEAEGVEGDSVVTFWFSELVNDSTATNILNVSLSGGLTIDSILVYGSWSTDTASMATARGWAGAATIGENLYVVGGYTGSYLTTLEVYDSTTGAWTTLASMPTARRAPVVGAIDNLLYVAGGYNGSYLTTLEIYDPATDTWSTGTPMQYARESAGGGIINGRLYVIGGYNGINMGLTECYDPATDSWSDKTSIPTLISEMASGIINGKLYIAGGWTGSFSAGLYAYDPDTDSWSTLTLMPNARRDPRGGAIGGRFYVAGGYGATGYSNKLEVYDPATGDWTGMTPLPVGVRAPAVSVVDDVLYVAGGHDGTSPRNQVMAYTPQDYFDTFLASGQSLPAEGTELTITATAIPDEHGNTASSLNTNFNTSAAAPSLFQPDIAVYGPHGVQSDDVTLTYSITDSDSSLVGLLVEYSTDSGSTWSAAAVTGDTSNIAKADYDSSLVWNSTSNLAGQTIDNVRVRITPYDSGGYGTTATVFVNIDNAAMTSVSASGNSGYSTFRFWFNEAPTESTATNPANFTLSGGITPDTIAVVEEWAAEQIIVPSFKRDAGVGTLNGKLYVVGGYTTNTSVYTNSMEIYDPATGTWAPGTNMPTARRNPLVAGINGKLYVTGGYNGSDVAITEIYDPVTNTWSTSAAPTTPINNDDYYFRGDVINGKWYVNSHDGFIHVYDPQQDAWTTISGGIPFRGVAVATINGKLYMAGGTTSPYERCAVFDPATGFTDITLAILQTGRYNSVGGTIDGKFYVISGTRGSATIEIYDPVTDTWRFGADAPAYDDEHLGATINGKIYFGREINPGSYIQITFDIYSWDKLDMTLQAGDRLPSEPNTVTFTANNQRDRAGNIIPSVETTFTPSSGNAPAIGLYHTGGPVTGDITVHHVVKDDENNPVWLLAEYSTDGGATWNPATITGDTADVQSASFEADLIWLSGTDLPNESHENVRFRVKVRDHLSTWGGEDTASIDVDNKAPASVNVNGLSGSATFTYWFDEIVTEASATNMSNISLTGGTQTIAGVATNEQWTSDALTVPTGKTDAGVGELDGKLYVVGGYLSGNLNTVQVYDPVTKTWSNTAPMLSTRRRPVVHGVDGKLYVIGGTGASGEAYDPETDSWSVIADAPYSIDYYNEFGDVIDGKIYLNTGDGGGHILVYDPNFDTWQNLTGGISRGGGTAAAIGGKLYITGGYSGGYKNDTLVYDPATGNLTPLLAMPTGRNDIVGGVIDGMFCVVGGYNSTDGNLDVVEIYDPGTNTWTTGDPAPHESDFQFGAVVRNRFYFGREVVTSSLFDVFSRDTYTATLTAGQGLPAPPKILTFAASGIIDPLGHTSGAFSTGLTSSVGNVASIDLYGPSGRRRGNVPVKHLIQDDENNSVWLKAEYSDDGGAGWYTATVTGVLDSLRGSGYESTLIWHSATDLPGTDDIVHFRVTLQEDRSSWNGSDTVPVRLDNSPPETLHAEGSSGDSSLAFWFDEEVSDSTATVPANFSLTGGLTVGGIQLIDSWTIEAIVEPTLRYNVGIGQLGGKFFTVGGVDADVGHEVTTVEVYNPETETWSSIADMTNQRYHPLVVGMNGLLYVLGGYDSGNLNDIEVYDPGSGTWSARNNMPFDGESPGRFHGSVINGKLYVNHYQNGIYIYDPNTDTWQNIGGGNAVNNATTVAFGGKLYIAGGVSGSRLTDFYVFDPTTQNTAALPFFTVPRETPTVGVIDGKIYVVGGYNGSADLTDVEIYDPVAQSWSTGTPVSRPQPWQHGLALNGIIYLGSRQRNDVLAKYYTSFDTYTRDGYELTLGSGEVLPPPPATVTLTATSITDWVGNTQSSVDTTFTPSSGAAPAIRIYEAGGLQGGDVTINYEISDNENNPVWLLAEFSTDDGATWQAAAVSGDTIQVSSTLFNGSLTWNSATDLADQEGWDVGFRITVRDNNTSWGGSDTAWIDVDNLAPQSIEVDGDAGANSLYFWFDDDVSEETALETNNFTVSGLTTYSINVIEEWTQDAVAMPTNRYNVGYGVMDDLVYAVGGYSDEAGDEVATVAYYDPETDSWTTTVTPMDYARSDPFVAEVAGLIYVIGGYNNGSLNVVEVYDPDSDSWSTLTTAPFSNTSPYYFNGASINGKIYLNHYDGNIYIYDPPTDTWESVAEGLNHLKTAVAAIDGKLYIAGGYLSGVRDELIVFDPVTRTSTALAAMPTPREHPFGSVIDGRFFVIGGYNWDFGGALTTVEFYDPATNTWDTTTSAPRHNNGTDRGFSLWGGSYSAVVRWNSIVGYNLTAFDTYDRGSYELHLDPGEGLPTSPNTVTVTATGIADWRGNTASSIQTTFTPSSGNPPGVSIYALSGYQSGDVPIRHLISDDEENPVWILAEYQLFGETVWYPATVTGDTAGVTSANYEGVLTWNSGSDIPDTRRWRVTFRLSVHDGDPASGATAEITLSIDNRVPGSMSARGVSGDPYFELWFAEPVQEDVATVNTNYSISDGLTIDNVAVQEVWDRIPQDSPSYRYGVGTINLGNRMYVIGGYDNTTFTQTDRVEMYNPTTEAWTELTPMPTPRDYPVCWTLDGKIWVLGGYNGNVGDVYSLEIYDPVSDSWETRSTPVSYGRSSYWNGGAIKGMVYLNTYSNEVLIYDPVLDDWTNNIAGGGQSFYGASTAVIDDKLYIVGGWDGSAYSSQMSVFDPADNSTTVLSSMPTDRQEPVTGVIDGRLYVVGGMNYSGQLSMVEIYDPVALTWSLGVSANSLIHGNSQSSAILNGKLYFGTGFWDGTNSLTTYEIYDRTRYQATLSAGQTLSFQEYSLEAYGITDWLGNTAGTVTGTFVPDDGNNNPVISLVDDGSEVSGDVTINYTITDTESDAVRLIPEYSTDSGTTWMRATTSGDTLNIQPAGYTGSLTWYTGTDLPGLDLDEVFFRITPSDNALEIGTADITGRHVDNNQVPSAVITNSAYTSTDTTWTFDYTLTDAESDTLSLAVEFSTDGGGIWTTATTPSSITGLLPATYTGSLVWQVERDLPGAVTRADFRITPSDIDEGTPATEGVNLNAYGVPTVTIDTTFVDEQNGDILLPFTITDPEGEAVSLLVEYQDTGGTWYAATVTGDTSALTSAEYTGTLTWHSGTDRDGVDDAGCTVRIAPYDANSGFAAQVDMHLDNNDLPLVSSVALAAGIQHRDVTVSYTLNDTEGDALGIQALYSLDSGSTWLPMTLTGDTTGITFDNYANSLTWHAFDDLGYGEYTGVMAKLELHDLDPGTGRISSTGTVHNYVGDYSADGSVSSADFATLVSAYNTQDAYYDIGPATGTVPLLIPTFDGVIDFEDLAVFIQMWNWSLGITTQAEAAGLLTRPTEKVSGSSAAEHPVQLEERMPDDLWVPDSGVLEIDLRANRLPASMVVSIEIDYDAEHLEFLNLEPGPFMGKAGGEGQTLLSLKNVDSERGRLSLLLGRIDREDPEVSGNGLLAGLQFKKLSKENSDITVAYELWNRNAEMTTQAVYETEVQALRIPNNFELLQNYPNPFNGETMIRFKLPTEQRVQLYVYNIRGQRVATIIDERMDAGYHRVTWTGRNDDGRQVGSGIYIYLIQAGPHRQSKKLTYIK